MVRPTYSYATDNVKRLDVNQRHCIFAGENVVNGQPVMKLPLKTDKYASGNCFAECRSSHMVKFCNCTIAFFFEAGTKTPCTMAGVKCLNQYDSKPIHKIGECFNIVSFFTEILNYIKPPAGNPFFDDTEEGISCECWQECTRIEYAIEISPNIAS